MYYIADDDMHNLMLSYAMPSLDTQKDLSSGKITFITLRKLLLTYYVYRNCILKKIILSTIKDFIDKKYPKYTNITSDKEHDIFLGIVQVNPHLLDFMENLSEKFKIDAAGANNLSIIFFDRPSEEVQLSAINRSESNIYCIKNPTELVQQKVAQKNYTLVADITNLCQEAQNITVKQSRLGIKYINNPTMETELLHKELYSEN